MFTLKFCIPELRFSKNLINKYFLYLTLESLSKCVSY